MFRLEPVGEHVIEVCTNISCGLKGAQQVVEAFESELGVAAGETNDEFTLRTVECLGGCGWATIVAVNNRHRLHVQADDVPCDRRGVARGRPGGGACRRPTPEIVFAGTNGGALTEIDDYEAVGGFTALAKARGADPGRGDRGAQRVEPARSWRRVLPHRAQVELRPEAGQDPEAALPRDQRRRVGAGHLQGSRDHAARPVPVPRGLADRRPCDRVDARLHLHPRRVRGRVRGARLRARADARPGTCSATSRSSSTAVLVPTSAARRRRSSSRSRAGAGQPRTKPPFPAIAGLYASPTAVNNVESITSATTVMEIGGAEYAKLGVESSTGTRVFSLSGNVVNGGNYELPHGFPLRDLIDDIGGGIADGRTLKAVIPGGSSTVILTADEADRVTLDFDSLVAAGTAIGSAAVIAIDDRCCMVQLAVRVSQFYEHESCGKCTPCRVGTKWLTTILQKIEDGRGNPGGHGSARLGLRADQRQVPVPARRLRRDRRDELFRQVPRRVQGAHRRRGAARSTAPRRSTSCSLPSPHARPRPGPVHA